MFCTLSNKMQSNHPISHPHWLWNDAFWLTGSPCLLLSSAECYARECAPEFVRCAHTGIMSDAFESCKSAHRLCALQCWVTNTENFFIWSHRKGDVTQPYRNDVIETADWPGKGWTCPSRTRWNHDDLIWFGLLFWTLYLWQGGYCDSCDIKIIWWIYWDNIDNNDDE